ncbi:hypothetical protein [Candidatus Carsonella ruddii]|uniref:Putative tmRNA-binding protein n=1 Tax=Candidatus Carsonella ruddii PC isolate NHV TaxID=1202540 RepID=J3TEP2_CARRU|nr:hypothetical protein [Candidatus Carsonella ruddii]AFP84287.1 putative tmRNA-binding protein [Candidatus Carsonella ruddii PC isolate NHV]
MLKKNKKILIKYFIIKTFISGMILKSNDVLKIKTNIFNINFYIIKFIDNNICLLNNKNKKIIILLLNRKERNIILFYKRNINYDCIPIEVFKLNFIFKLKISIVKKRKINKLNKLLKTNLIAK